MLGCLACLATSACIHPIKRMPVDECYQLVREAMLVQTKCPAFSKDYMILDQEALPYSCLDNVVDSLSVGERVRINEIIYQFQGETGSCWRVFADLPGREEFGVVEIPACFPGLRHPSGWATVKDWVVQVNPERLELCSNMQSRSNVGNPDS